MNKCTKPFFAALLLAASTMATAQPIISNASGGSTVSASKVDILGQPKSRAEVRADLVMWEKAGLDKFWSQERTPDTHSREYRAAYVNYVRLRTGPEFSKEVERQLRQ